MYKFKKGDRVRVIKFMRGVSVDIGDTGTVLDNDSMPSVRFDRNIDGHSCGGRCEYGYGYNCYEDNLELIIEKTNTITLILGNTAYEITGENITIKTKQL